MMTILRLVLLLSLIATPCFAQQMYARMNPYVAGSGVVAAAPAKASFSDNFNRADNDDLGANWTEIDTDLDIVSNALSMITGGGAATSAIYTGTATNGVDQYVSVDITWLATNTFPVIILRYTDASSHLYGIECDYYCTCYWKHYATYANIGGGNTIGDATDIGGGCHTAPRKLGVTIAGTGDDTVVRVWYAPTATTPVSATEWDSGDSTPDVAWTTNPGANAVDTGNYVGLGGSQTTASQTSFDNFFGGDIP